MKIEEIFVAGFKHDVQFTRTCVASIRRWHPHVRITLIKDRFYGDYPTTDIERHFNCGVLATGQTRYGWGFGKLEPLFLPGGRRFLVLDSDIVLAGPVLDRLGQIAADFMVQHEEPTAAFVRSHYFDLERVRAIDPAFAFPGYTFNTGQWVGTAGKLSREDFAPFVTGTPPRVRDPEMFRLGEQGLLNYVLMKQAAAGRLTLVRDRFMEVGDDPPVAAIDLERLRAGPGYPFLIHWCGLRRPDFDAMVRGDILRHFESVYYARLPAGRWRRSWFYLRRKWTNQLKQAVRSWRPRADS